MIDKETFVKRLPKIDTEISLIDMCNNTIQTCNIMDNEELAVYKTIKAHAESILLRTIEQLDKVTNPVNYNEHTSFKNEDFEIDKETQKWHNSIARPYKEEQFKRRI
jgi:hypothetical protein